MAADGRPYPIYIVLTPFREIAPSVRVVFRALQKIEPHLAYAEGYYRDDGDEALLALHFERAAVERVGAQELINAVARCNLPLIAPEELELERRVSFHHEHLSTFPTFVQRYRMPEGSLLQELLLALEEHVASFPEDEHYESVEVSADDHPVRPGKRKKRATSKWELELESDSQAHERASSEPDFRL